MTTDNLSTRLMHPRFGPAAAAGALVHDSDVGINPCRVSRSLKGEAVNCL